MNQLSVSFLILAIGSVAFTQTAEARDRVDRRQNAQRVRMRQGIANGELTRSEAARVRASGRAIERKEERFEANDGQIGAAEAQRLENLQDRRSRQIHRLKNNDQVRQAPASDAGPDSDGQE